MLIYEPKRQPRYARDPDGRCVVLVPLANHPLPAVVDKDDFGRLVHLGLSQNWCFNANRVEGARYVRMSGGRNKKQAGKRIIARLILEAPARRVVKYHDGDRLNLRRTNLYLTEGPAKARELAALDALSQLALARELAAMSIAAE